MSTLKRSSQFPGTNISRKYDKLTRKKDQLKEAFNAADKKDVQLQAEMVQTNNNRKKYKQQLEDERKKLAQLQNVPDENKKVRRLY